MLSILDKLYSIQLEYADNFSLPSTSARLESNKSEQINIASEYFLPYRYSIIEKVTPTIQAIHRADIADGLYNAINKLPLGTQITHHPDTSYDLRCVDSFKIFSSKKGSPHCIVVSDGKFVVVTDGTDAPESYKPSLRLVREMFVRNLELQGGFSLHASAAAIDGRGYLFVGDSGAGKTSIATAVARCLGGRFLSSDRAILKPTNGTYEIIPWPMVINIGLGACRAINSSDGFWEQHLPETANAYFQHYGKTFSEQLSFLDSDKYALTPGEAQNLLSVKISAKEELFAVIFPELAEGPDSFCEFTEEPFTATMSAFQRQLRCPEDRTYPFGIVECAWRDPEKLQVHCDEVLTRVAKTVRCLRLRISKPALTKILRSRSVFDLDVALRAQYA
ncbi:hypothetical protein [Phyllobacterium leguminum]|uniref:Hpr(Ser) kinase/phosphatase n=1 Tax=Phyllobacterium leguminum TaxID=314237 RepID=A0A318TE60_9HYPH|nr:hypothetical protein [Phyllobacterium leguminum]PYE86680.1 hypothetical protein C7477_12145 [Phyllobacterium leguminum]